MQVQMDPRVHMHYDLPADARPRGSRASPPASPALQQATPNSTFFFGFFFCLFFWEGGGPRNTRGGGESTYPVETLSAELSVTDSDIHGRASVVKRAVSAGAKPFGLG